MDIKNYIRNCTLKQNIQNINYQYINRIGESLKQNSRGQPKNKEHDK